MRPPAEPELTVTHSRSPVSGYLQHQGLATDHELYIDNLGFEKALKKCTGSALEEAVPAEMMQLFSDAQWNQLLFEFQPSMQIFSSEYDIPQLRQRIERGEMPAIPAAGELAHWLVFRDDKGELVRPLSPREYRCLTEACNGREFASIAAMVWPALDTESAHRKLTEILLGWLNEGLVTDAGVPLPADAEFEQA